MATDRSPAAQPTGWIARRHELALYDLFCDDQANEHYGTPTQGLAYRFWRIRVYLRGFFQKLPSSL